MGMRVFGCSSSKEPIWALAPIGFSSLGDWVCLRVFFLGSEHMKYAMLA
jgi:hypothetical protein